MDIISISDKSSYSGSNKSKRSNRDHQLIKPGNGRAVTLSSESTLRCPVSDGSTCHPRLPSMHPQGVANCTPPTFLKVKSWFEKCPQMERNLANAVDTKQTYPTKMNSPNVHSLISDNIHGRINSFGREEPRSSILISNGTPSAPRRKKSFYGYDYKKTDHHVETQKFVLNSDSTSHTSTNNTLEKMILQPESTNSKPEKSRARMKRRSVDSPRSTKSGGRKERSASRSAKSECCDVIEISESSQSPSLIESLCNDYVENRNTENVAPLSPETRKKNEFCTYLQLMNLSDTNPKDNIVHRNRRSTRVQNQFLNSVRRELQTQAPKKEAKKGKIIKKSTEIIEKLVGLMDSKNSKKPMENGTHEEQSLNPSGKSFSELNLDPKKMTRRDSEGSDSNIFEFNFKKDILLKEMDFDVSILEYFEEENIETVNTKKSMRRSMSKCREKPENNSDKENLVNVKGIKRKSSTKVVEEHHKIRSTEDDDPSEDLSNENITKIIFGDIVSPVVDKNNKSTQSSESGKSQKKRELKKSNKRVLNMMRIHSKRMRRKLGTSLLKFTSPASKKSTPGKLKKTTPNKQNEKVQKVNGLLPSETEPQKQTASSVILQNKSFEVRILCSSSEDKKSQEEKKEKSDSCLDNVLELSPALEHLRQTDNLKYLAPEHFKSLVESKKFLNSKKDDIHSSPMLPKTIMKKVNLKKPVIPETKTIEATQSVDAPILETEVEIVEEKAEVKEDRIKDKPELNEIVVCDSSSQSDHEHVEQSESESSDGAQSNANTIKTGNQEQERECEISSFAEPETVNTHEISSTNCDYIPVSSDIEMKSLHRSLVQSKRKSISGLDSDEYSNQGWETDSHSTNRTKGKRHASSFSINISEMNGGILNIFYIDFNLVIAQELVVSFWNQTALGNVLGAQNMWIPKGCVQRLVLDNECNQKASQEMMISMENSAAYIELWTKEHVSFNRERPVADVFAAIYFWRNSGLDKKVLQLENIKGFADDVQYIVIRNSRSIVVSWNTLQDDEKTTIVHSYNLASDYQSVVNIKELASVNHYVSSLHNIEDCDTIIMGSGDYNLTLWNLEYGYIIATIELIEIRPQPRTLWVKCDRGFLFVLQKLDDEVLRLIAINGISHEWKKLQLYKASDRHKGLKGVCIENGIIAAFYETGVSCWNVQLGECVLDEVLPETIFVPSNKHVLLISDDEIHVRHALSYLLTLYDP